MQQQRRSTFTNSAPMPVVKEMEGEAGWDEWERAVQHQEEGFAPTAPASLQAAHGTHREWFAATQPSPLQPAAPTPAPARPRNELTLEQVLQEARRNNRICPKPDKWMSMYALLAANAKEASLPPPPLTGVVWERTPAMPKRMSFIEHVEWAAANGCLPAVHAFLKSLKEADWHYMS